MKVETQYLGTSSAAERNREPILEILKEVFAERRNVLEIGSGTGQHASYLAGRLLHLVWQPSDCAEYLAELTLWIDRYGTENVLSPVELDVRSDPWPVSAVDAIFSANTLHIMSWRSVEHFFSGVGKVLEAGGLLCLYGPFSYAGELTAESNVSFDAFLRQRDSESGIRDFVTVNALAEEQGLRLLADHVMPANNQMLVWKR